MTYTVITPSVSAPVSVAELKEHLRILTNEHDNYIGRLNTAATSFIERQTGQFLAARTIEVSFDSFANSLWLNPGPAYEIVSVKYTDANGIVQTLPTDQYVFDASKGRIVVAPGKAWPATQTVVNAVKVVYKAGYVTLPDEVSEIKQAIQLMVGHWYDNRSEGIEPNGALRFAVDQLLPRPVMV